MLFTITRRSTSVIPVTLNEYENANDWYAITKTKTRMLIYEMKIILKR